MRLRATALLFASLFAGCGGGLTLNLVDAAYHRPSNVAVYFTVDTSSGNPVPGLQASDFHIYEDGQLVSADESQQTIVNPEVAAEHYTLLLVDMSGSVTRSNEVPLIEDAANQFISTLQGVQRVAVYAFDGSADIHPITPFTGSTGGAERGVARLTGFHARDPSTNLNGAIVKAVDVLSGALSHSTTPLHFGTLVVFTDGTDRAARVSYDDMMNALGQTDFDVFTIGVGNEIDADTLSDIGRSGFVRVDDAGALKQAFEDIGKRIVGYTQRYYLLSYCSPARAGQHEVTIEAVSTKQNGELSYSFDATGFGPTCNPSQPPPFDTSGAGRGHHGGAHAHAHGHAHASGSARMQGGVNPEEGVY